MKKANCSAFLSIAKYSFLLTCNYCLIGAGAFSWENTVILIGMEGLEDDRLMR